MRFLFVHERLGAMAGAEVNAYVTAAELRQRGHTIGLLHGPSTGKSEPAWHETFSERFALAARNNVQLTQAAVDQFDPDVVYVHKMADLAVLRTLMESRMPLVRMVHDHDIYCMRSYKYHPLTRKICARPASGFCVFPCGASLVRNRHGGWPFRWVSYLKKKKEIALNRRFHRMLVATDYMKEQLLRNGFDPGRIEIHPPVPRYLEAAAQSSFSARNLIVYAGQLVRGKGVDVLLQSLAQLSIPFQCVILGDGSHKQYCQSLSRDLGLEERVSFKGYLAPELMRSFYADASLAVMSSVWPEPFGAVGLEAMRYGLPVVAFDAGGIREWLIDEVNGFLVPLMDRAKFAHSVQRLLQDKALARQMGTRGRQLVHDKYNFSRYISGLEAMFARVIAEREGSPSGLQSNHRSRIQKAAPRYSSLVVAPGDPSAFSSTNSSKLPLSS